MLEVVLLMLLGAVTLLVWWLNGCYSYWKAKGVVQPPTVLGFGNYKDAFFGYDNAGHILVKTYSTYPNNDAVGLYNMLSPRLLVRSTELVKQVMASEFSSFHDNEFFVTEKLDPLIYADPFNLRGDEWKAVRSKLSSFMTQNKLKEIYPLMKEAVSRMEVYVNDKLAQDFDAKELATLFTMDNVSSCVFGIISNCFTEPEATFRKMRDIVMVDQLQVFWKTMIINFYPRLRDLIGLRVVPKSVHDYLVNMITEVKNHRIKNNVVRNDLIQHIISKTGENDRELVMHASTFFLEGFETSSMVASSVLYELSMNPKVQDILHEELTAAYQDPEGFEYDTLGNLTYLDKVFQETMRKYPVMYAYVRLCTKNTTMEIDGKTVDIEKGTPVAVPVYGIHYDPRYYPNPEVFEPERFSEQGIASRPPYTYMPLGEGPRICPGSRFGTVQVKLFIAHLVLKYRILRTVKTPTQLTPDSKSFMVVPIEQIWIKLAARK